jgi:hypothetical protein
MSRAQRSPRLSRSAEIKRLTLHAAKHGATLDTASAKEIAVLEPPVSTRKLDGILRLIRATGDEGFALSTRQALSRVDACGGDAEEAFRRTLAGGVEFRPGVADTVGYAAQRGVVFTPNSVYQLLRRRGLDGTRRYIDDLAAIMDVASELGVECSQDKAKTRLWRAGGDAGAVVAGFRAAHRRRQDRRTAPCRVAVPPRELASRSDAFAGCGCPRCLHRLAVQMQRYIARLVARPFCARLDREEARAEANLELIESVECWPGGNFTGWFAARFGHRIAARNESRALEESTTVSLDAPGVLADDAGGRLVSLAERIPDRSCDVLTIVLLRERLSERALELRQVRADRGEEYLAEVHGEALALAAGVTAGDG